MEGESYEHEDVDKDRFPRCNKITRFLLHADSRNAARVTSELMEGESYEHEDVDKDRFPRCSAPPRVRV
jgi:hypothetical protein